MHKYANNYISTGSHYTGKLICWHNYSIITCNTYLYSKDTFKMTTNMHTFLEYM